MLEPTDVRLEDIVRMRKPHPCGGTDWQVVRLGTDIGLVCLNCQHKILLPRGRFLKQIKEVLHRGPKLPPLPT